MSKHQKLKNDGGYVMTDDTRIALLEQSISHINETLVRLEKRFEHLDQDMKRGFEFIHGRLDTVNNRFDSLNNRLWFNFFWVVGGFAGVLLVMAHGFHWL